MPNQQVVGAVIEFVGASLAIVGLNAQKWAADGDQKAATNDAKRANGASTSSCCSWRWLLAIALFVAGQVTQVVAFAFGSQSLVAAMSNLSLVTNAVVAHLWFGEPFHLRPRDGWRDGLASFPPDLVKVFVGWDMGAVALVVAGTIITGVCSTPPPAHDPRVAELRAMFLAKPYLICLVSSLALAMVALRELRSGKLELETMPRRSGALYAVSAASLASVSVTLSKVSVLLLKLTVEGENQFHDVASFLFVTGFVGFAVINLRVLNEGLAKYEASFVIPIYYVVSTLLTILQGEVLYRTYVQLWLHLWPTGSMFLFGLGVALFGVHVIATPAEEDFDVDDMDLNDVLSLDVVEANVADGVQLQETSFQNGGAASTSSSIPASRMPTLSAPPDAVQPSAPAPIRPRVARVRTLTHGSAHARPAGAAQRRSSGAALTVAVAASRLRRLSSTGRSCTGRDFSYPTRMHRTGSMDMFAVATMIAQGVGGGGGPVAGGDSQCDILPPPEAMPHHSPPPSQPGTPHLGVPSSAAQPEGVEMANNPGSPSFRRARSGTELSNSETRALLA